MNLSPEHQEQMADEARMKANALAAVLAQRARVRSDLRELTLRAADRMDVTDAQTAVDEGIRKLVDLSIAFGQCP